MNKNFKKIKTKITIEKLLVSLFIGLFSGLLISSILILIYKQLGLYYKLWLFIIIGVVLFIVISLGIFFLLKPNNIKTAKRIDRQLNLKEKVHTMVEYEDKEGYLINLQREDANVKLNDIPSKKLKFKFSPYLLIIPVIVLPLFITSIVVKGKEIAEPPVVEPISGDPYIIGQIRTLIEEVKKDNNLMTEVKDAYVTNLEELITDIDDPNVTRSDEVAAVNKSITNLGYSSLTLNSIDEIITALTQSNMDESHNLGVALATYELEEVNKALDDIKVKVMIISPDGRKSKYEELVTNLFEKVDAERINADDEFYSVIKEFETDLYEAINSVEWNTNINSLFEETKSKFGDAIIRQAETIIMANYLEEQLRMIFEIPSDNGEIVNPPIPNVPGDNEDPIKPGEGGGGSGEIIYAGDDPVYDPDKGTVPYYKVIDKYYAYFQGLVQDGKISEELANYYIEYFNKLYSSSEDNE